VTILSSVSLSSSPSSFYPSSTLMTSQIFNTYPSITIHLLSTESTVARGVAQTSNNNNLSAECAFIPHSRAYVTRRTWPSLHRTSHLAERTSHVALGRAYTLRSHPSASFNPPSPTSQHQSSANHPLLCRLPPQLASPSKPTPPLPTPTR